MNIKLNEYVKQSKINWSNFHYFFDDCQNDSEIEFEVMPLDYLNYAKENLLSDNESRLIDSLSNAKRAIEAQIDLMISTLGYDYSNFDKYNSYPHVKRYINEMYQGDSNDGIVPRMKLLNILGLAPTLIISEIRDLRNKMEHEYIKPTEEFVKKSIEIADLFIHSCNRKWSYSFTWFYFGNTRIEKSKKINLPMLISRNFEYPYITIHYLSNTDIGKSFIIFNINDEIREEVVLTVEDEKYIHIIEFLLKEDIKKLVDIFSLDIDKRFINCKKKG